MLPNAFIGKSHPPSDAEGTTVRIEIVKAKDIETVVRPAGIKLAH